MYYLVSDFQKSDSTLVCQLGSKRMGLLKSQLTWQVKTDMALLPALLMQAPSIIFIRQLRDINSKFDSSVANHHRREVILSMPSLPFACHGFIAKGRVVPYSALPCTLVKYFYLNHLIPCNLCFHSSQLLYFSKSRQRSIAMR